MKTRHFHYNLFVLQTIAIIFFSVYSFAQTPADGCGFVPDDEFITILKNPNSRINQRLNYLKQFPLRDIYNLRKLELINGKFNPNRVNEIQGEISEDILQTLRSIPVVAHVVRRSNSSGGITTQEINTAINTANDLYKDLNMTFEVCEIRFIDSDGIFDTNFSGSADNNNTSTASYNVLNVTSRNIERKLNIYFVPNSTTSWAWRPNTASQNQHIIMNNGQATNGITLQHELGHWFGLLHTHGSSNNCPPVGNETDELVDGSNCSSSGDFVCDTAADPNLCGRHNASCEFTATNLTDTNGDDFAPDVRNIMAYSSQACREIFSEGQIFVIQSSLLGMQNDRGYTFGSCQGVGERVVDYKWGEGWTNTEFFTVNNQTYLFLLKQKGLSGSDKRVHIHKMNSDGKVGQRVVDYKWGEGWTNTEFYTSQDETYLFILKQNGLSGSKKNVHIHIMNKNGTVGRRIADYKWGEGWTNTEFYTSQDETYLFILKQNGLSGSNKNVHIHKIK